MADSHQPPETPSHNDIFNPIVLIATAILLSVFVLIGAAIAGWDKGVLSGMARIEFARGLITYLFAVVTIGTAVVLVVSALTGTESDVHEKRFQRGKEILSLLLGVFGTIVGFYFGSEVSGKGALAESTLRLAPIHLSVQVVPSGGQITVESAASGGKAPYKFGVGFGNNEIQPSDSADVSGWIAKSVTAPSVTTEQALSVRVAVVDAEGHSAERSAPVAVKPASK
jgi:hypothetical protein